MSININQNWNDMSSSSEDSDDDNKEEETISQPQTSTTPTAPIPSRTEPAEEPVKTGGEEAKPVRERQERRKTFLSDEQLLNQYINQTVDDPKAIKVSRCMSEEVREIVKNLKTARVVELNESTFLLFFYKEEDLIEFFREKIAKRYKFYFNMFERRERKEDDPKFRNKERKDSYNNNRRPQRRNTRTSQDDKKEKEASQQPEKEKAPAREEEKKQEKKKKRYSSSSSDEEEKINKQVKPAQPEQTKEKSQEKPEEKPSEKLEEKQGKLEEEVKPRRNTQHKFMFEIAQNSNVIVIHSDTFDTHKVLEAMSRKKMMKQFSKIHIKAPFYSFSQVSILIMEIAKFNFFLDKEPPTEADSEQEFELVLVEKGENKSDAFYDSYHKMTIQKDLHVRMLSSKFDDYFMDIDKYNLSEIVEGFDANEYIKRLKQTGPLIQKHWNTWKIEAEEDHIETLLKLINRIKKSTVYDIDLKPSLRNEKALLTAQLRERPEKERRPKVDVSNVYNYLS